MSLNILHVDYEKMHFKSSLGIDVEFMIQFGHLFSDHFTMAGFSGFVTLFERYFQKMTVYEKAKYLSGKPYEFLGRNEAENQALINYMNLQKKFNAHKSITPEVFAMMKKTEKKVGNLIGDYLEGAYLKRQIERIKQFKPLVESGKIAAYPILEPYKQTMRGGLELDKLLLRKLPFDFNHGPVWFISHYYYSDIFLVKTDDDDENTRTMDGDGPIKVPTEEVDKDFKIADVYFEPLLQFPKIEACKLDELAAMKNALHEPWSEARALISEWAKKCYAGENAQAFIKSRDAKKTMARAQELLNENLVIQYYRNFRSAYKGFTVYATEMNPGMFLKFNMVYADFNFDEYPLIHENLDTDNPRFSVPVFMIWPDFIPFGYKTFKADADAEMAKADVDNNNDMPEVIFQPGKKKLNVEDDI